MPMTLRQTAVLKERWQKHLTTQNVALSEEQKAVAEVLLNAIATDILVSRFFRGRCRGVTTLFNEFEHFCKNTPFLDQPETP